jgi:hypothetical protein
MVMGLGSSHTIHDLQQKSPVFLKLIKVKMYADLLGLNKQRKQMCQHKLEYRLQIHQHN